MSLPTWTPNKVSSEACPGSQNVWRIVENQHVAATMKIVDTLSEQKLLETIIEKQKPTVPSEAKALDYLLFTPFRYLPPAGGSRFRAPHDPGVFYEAERITTAAAETSFRRWQFLQDTTGLDRLPPTQYTAFSIPVGGPMVDLRRHPFDIDAWYWQHPLDYQATQQFGRTAKEASINTIIYQSVRDPEPHFCMAVLSPTAFQADKPRNMQNWTMTMREKRLSGRHGEKTRSHGTLQVFDTNMERQR